MQLRKYLPLALGVPICLAAGWIELQRALDGHVIAWVYAVEWPFFGVVGTYIWWRTWHPPVEHGNTSSPTSSAPGSVADDRDSEDVPAAIDPERQAWERYLARLHAADPPGGPPDKR